MPSADGSAHAYRTMAISRIRTGGGPKIYDTSTIQPNVSDTEGDYVLGLWQSCATIDIPRHEICRTGPSCRASLRFH